MLVLLKSKPLINLNLRTKTRFSPMKKSYSSVNPCCIHLHLQKSYISFFSKLLILFIVYIRTVSTLNSWNSGFFNRCAYEVKCSGSKYFSNFLQKECFLKSTFILICKLAIGSSCWNVVWLVCGFLVPFPALGSRLLPPFSISGKAHRIEAQRERGCLGHSLAHSRCLITYCKKETQLLKNKYF